MGKKIFGTDTGWLPFDRIAPLRETSPFAKIRHLREGGPARPGAGLGVGSGRRKKGEQPGSPRGAGDAVEKEPKVQEWEPKFKISEFANAHVKAITPLGDGEKGASSSFKLVLEHGTTGATKTFCFKPVSGEATVRHHIPPGTMARREAFAGLAQKAMEFNDNPEATMFHVPGHGDGSIMEWIEGQNLKAGLASNRRYLSPESEDSLAKMLAFDLVMKNSDRHPNNFKVDMATGRVVMIDNNLTLPRNDSAGAAAAKWRVMGIEKFADKPITDAVRKGLKSYVDRQAKLMELAKSKYGFDEADTAALAKTFDRAKKILAKGKFPKPKSYKDGGGFYALQALMWDVHWVKDFNWLD
jgi:hypothetical protein